MRKAISATLEKCPYCQKEINQHPEQSQEDIKSKKLNIKKILFIAYAVLSVFVILGLYNSLSSSKMNLLDICVQHIRLMEIVFAQVIVSIMRS